MILRKPLFWDYKKPNLLSNILLPFTSLIKINNILINRKKKPRSKNIKTICIGNIYIGGTGKTPTTITLYNIVKKITSSVATAKKFYAQHEDEHKLLKKKTNLILGKTRREIVNKGIKYKKKILIFDDGLQDKNIDYDLKFVCFNSKKWIGNGRLIPSGPLREKLESLKKYDGIFLNNQSIKYKSIANLIKSYNPKIEIFITQYKIRNLSIFKKKKYLAFSGIGNPDDFKKTLIDNKIRVAKEIIYPDHYNYKANDIKYIKYQAKKLDLEIITTEKDYVKISKLDKKNIKFLAIDLKIISNNKLLKFIKSKLYDKN